MQKNLNKVVLFKLLNEERLHDTRDLHVIGKAKRKETHARFRDELRLRTSRSKDPLRDSTGGRRFGPTRNNRNSHLQALLGLAQCQSRQALRI